MAADVATFDFGEARGRTEPPDSSTGHRWDWSDAEDGAAGAESLEEARDLIDREIERRRAS